MSADRSRSSTTAWATGARFRRRSSTWVLEAAITRRPCGARGRPTALVIPGVGAFPQGMRNLRDAGPRRAASRAAAGRHAGAGHLPGDAAAVRAVRGARAHDGLGLIGGEVTRAAAGGLRMPHIGWNEVPFRARVAAHGRAARRRLPLLPRALSGAPARGPRRTSSATDRVRRAVRHDRRARTTCSECSFTPRSPRRTGCRCWRNFVEMCDGAGRAARPAGAWTAESVRHDPAPGDRHPRRQGRPAGARLLRPATPCTTPTRSTRRGGGSPAGARALHVVDLDGARSRRAGQPRARPADRRRGRRAGAGGGRPAHASRRSRRRWRPARRGSSWARPLSPTSTSWTRRVAEHGDRVVVSVDARDGQLAASGWTEQTEIPAEAAIERSASAACAVRLLEHRARRHARRARPGGRARGSPTPCGARSCTPAGSPRSRTCGRSRRCARSTWPA